MKEFYIVASLFSILGFCNFDKNHHQAEKSYQTQRIISTQDNSLLYKTEQVHFPMNKENPNESIQKKDSVMLNVVIITQNPELKYGCEITSLAMVLNYAGVKTNKMELYQAIKKETDPLIKSQSGDIIKWGNPNEGFVGDMKGKQPGYAVFDQPIVQLINKYLPNRAVNLTNQPFENVLQHVSDGYPVVVWTTGDFRMPDRWEAWYHEQQIIKTPLDLHAVVLVGYDNEHVYVNDPLSGKKQVKINKSQFVNSWKALKCRAVSYK
ncbi:MAG: C39 family peptidase [Bacillota bacterium]|nr:C39 family peptidase [Bacillota bacterium]